MKFLQKQNSCWVVFDFERCIINLSITIVTVRKWVQEMRYKSAELKEKIYRFVNDRMRECGSSPSLGEIADAVHVSRTTVLRYLVEMDAEETLSYDGRTIGTREYNRRNMRFSMAKLVGEIPCGEAQEEEEQVEDYINLPVNVFGSGEFYALRASGDSMEDAGISDGDVVIILRQHDANTGDIVVALDDEGRNTLKQYRGRDADGNFVLAYRNEAVYPDKKILVKDLAVQGVASHVIKKLR